MRKQEDVEVEVKQPGVCAAEPCFVLSGSSISRSETNLQLRPRLDDCTTPSAHAERPVPWDMERGLVGTDRVDLVYDDATRKLVAELGTARLARAPRARRRR